MFQFEENETKSWMINRLIGSVIMIFTPQELEGTELGVAAAAQQFK